MDHERETGLTEKHGGRQSRQVDQFGLLSDSKVGQSPYSPEYGVSSALAYLQESLVVLITGWRIDPSSEFRALG